MTASLSDQLQIWGFEDDFVIFSDGTFGFGLDVTPIDISCWDEPRVDQLANRLRGIVNSLPEGSDLQIVQEIGAGNENLLSAHEKLTRDSVSQTALAVRNLRLDLLRDSDRAGEIPRRNLALFVRRTPTSALLKKARLFSRVSEFEEIAEKNLARELNETSQLREEIRRLLASVDMPSRNLAQREIAERVYWQWNPTRHIGLGQYDPENLRSYLNFTDAVISETGFSLGNMHHRVISLKLLPDHTFSGMARALGDLPFGSRLFVSLHVPNQQKELETLQTHRRIAFSMARGRRSGVSDIESEEKLQDIESLLSQMIAQGEKVFYMSLNVLLRSNDEEVLRDQVSMTLAKVRELGGAEAMEESLAAFDVFTELALPNARARERSKRLKSSNLADLLPLYGPWAGHDSPRILLRTAGGGIMGFDPFAPELSNYNQIVTGGSGSGKSFLTNVLLLQMLKECPRIFVVDIGGSYRKLCDNLDGQYIPFNLSSGLSLNPFDLAPGETAPSSHKIKFLVGLVEMMTKEEGEVRIGRLERAEIEEAITSIYQGTGSPGLSALRDLLLRHPDSEIRRFGKILTPWCGDTPFGRIVDRPTSVRLEKGIVSFDLKGLETYPELQAVCLYLITDFIWREVQRDRGTLKFLVFDECWKLLENEAGAAFIGEVFRTFRKYYASAIAISQNIDDFARSKVSGAILPNTSIKWVLMQKGADEARLREVLRLNDTEMALIASLHQERGIYSQAFLMAEDRHALVEISPTPLEYWIATTDPRDLALFEKRLKEGGTQLDVLNALAREYPVGVASVGGGP